MTSRRPIGKATRAAIVVTAVAVVMNTVIDLGSSGFYATFGVFILLVLSDFGGPLKTRFWAYIVTGIAGLGLIALGAVAATGLAATIVITALVVFALGYALLLRGYVSAAYLSLLLPYIVAVTTPQHLDTLPTSLGAYAGGALVAAITAVALWPSRPASELRQALGTTITAAARLLAVSPPLNPTAPPAETEARRTELATAYKALRKVYDGKLEREGSVTSRERGLIQLVDDIGRLRVSIGWTTGENHHATPADRELIEAVHDALDHCGSALSDGAPPADQVVDNLYAARNRHIDELPETAGELLAQQRSDHLIQVVDTGFRYRVSSFITAMIMRHTFLALGHRMPAADRALPADPVRGEIENIETVSKPLQLLRANLTLSSPWLRRALQIAAAVTIAVVVIHELHLSTGFWVILGVVASLQLTAIRSRKSALTVAVGTTAGFAICAALVYLVGKNIVLLICLLPIVAFLTVWYPHGKWLVPLKQAGYTVWFVMLVSLSHHGMSMRIDDVRIIDVCVGLAASLLITTILWHRGVATQVREVLDGSVRSTAAYFAAAYTYVASPMTDEDEAAIHKTARTAAAGRDQAAEAFDVAVSQGGATEQEAHEWVIVANAVDHAFVVGTMVRGLANYGLAPLPDAGIAARLGAAADRVSDEFTGAIDATKQAQGDSAPTITDEHTALSTAIESVVGEWAGESDELTFQIPPATFSMARGRAAISLLWAHDWLVYFNWMAQHSQPGTSFQVADESPRG